MKPIPIVALILFLSGCYTSYIGPVSGNLATLTIEKNDNYINFVSNTYVEARSCTGRLVLLAPLDKVPSKDFRIYAGKELSINLSLDLSWRSVGGGVEFKGCSVTGTFTPESDGNYLAKITVERGEELFCRLVLQEKSNEGGFRDIEFEARQWKRANTDSGSWCV